MSASLTYANINALLERCTDQPIFPRSAARAVTSATPSSSTTPLLHNPTIVAFHVPSSLSIPPNDPFTNLIVETYPFFDMTGELLCLHF